jgi:hypothetical protein
MGASHRLHRLFTGPVALGRPPRPQRTTAVASVGVELYRQDLVKLNDIRLEPQP